MLKRSPSDTHVKSGSAATLDLKVKEGADDSSNENGPHIIWLADNVWSIQALVGQQSYSNNRLPPKGTPVQVTVSAVEKAPPLEAPDTQVAFMVVFKCV